MPFAVGTTTGGLTAARITPRQGSWKLVGRPGEMPNDCKLALAQARGPWRTWLRHQAQMNSTGFGSGA
jgi:hypothetical protein